MKCVSLVAASLVAFVCSLGCNSSTSTSPVAPSVEQTNDNGQGRVADEGELPSPQTGPATEPMEGLILFAPLRSTETYLINAEKQIVHRWKSEYPPGNSAYLLENGDLLRGARDPAFDLFRGGGIGAMVERYSWEGELLWSFRYTSEDYCLHHDIAPMPNGNILMIAWERKSKEEAIAQGRDPDLLKDDLWPDHVIEVQPDGPDGGKIVWEWHMWDHLVQDFDREKPNYGVIYEHPELIDLNNTGSTPPSTPEELRKLRAVGYTGGGDDDDDDHRRGSADWLHTNAIHYNVELDQIALSAKNFSEVWIIDHSTTTEEAASHRGGKSGKGGDLLYRWGNPWSYKSGTPSKTRCSSISMTCGGFQQDIPARGTSPLSTMVKGANTVPSSKLKRLWTMTELTFWTTRVDLARTNWRGNTRPRTKRISIRVSSLAPGDFPTGIP